MGSEMCIRDRSGILTLAIFGSIVQKGKFSACIFCEVKALKRVDLPTFGKPTMPHLMLIAMQLIHNY